MYEIIHGGGNFGRLPGTKQQANHSHLGDRFQADVRGPEQAGPFGWNFTPGSMEGPWNLIIKPDEEEKRNRLNASLFTIGIKRELSGCKLGEANEGSRTTRSFVRHQTASSPRLLYTPERFKVRCNCQAFSSSVHKRRQNGSNSARAEVMKV